MSPSDEMIVRYIAAVGVKSDDETHSHVNARLAARNTDLRRGRRLEVNYLRLASAKYVSHACATALIRGLAADFMTGMCQVLTPKI